MNNHANSGHAINAASLSKFNLLIKAMATGYNPSNTAINAAAINKMDNDVQTALQNVNNTLVNWRNATNNRELLFETLDETADRVYAIFSSLGLPGAEVQDMKALREKLKGKGKPTKADAGKQSGTQTSGTGENTGPAAQPAADGANTKSHRSAQLAFDERLQNFEQIVMLAASEPKYAPNETELSIANLQKLLADLRTANTAANSSSVELKKARIERDVLLYDESNGVLAKIKQAQNYIKGLGAGASDTHKAAKAIKFRRVKPK